jgi:predicted DNA-binding transcriptional regulator AlpA
MPRAQRELNTFEVTQAFARKLRKLHDSGLARTDVKFAELEIDRIASREGIGRSTIYAALSGTRLPSRRTLRALVLAWDPQGRKVLPDWFERLREAQLEVQEEARYDKPSASGLRRVRRKPGPKGRGLRDVHAPVA